MDKRIEEIIIGFKRLLKGVESSFIAIAQKDNGDTVDVKDLNGTLYLKVRKVATDEKGIEGFLITPKDKSFVIVSRISNSDDLYVSMFSEIEKIKIQGGKNGGLTITPKLVEELNKNNEILQAILKTINTSVVNEPGNGSPSALQTALKTALAGKLVGDFSEIENNNIKH